MSMCLSCVLPFTTGPERAEAVRAVHLLAWGPIRSMIAQDKHTVQRHYQATVRVYSGGRNEPADYNRVETLAFYFDSGGWSFFVSGCSHITPNSVEDHGYPS